MVTSDTELNPMLPSTALLRILGEGALETLRISCIPTRVPPGSPRAFYTPENPCKEALLHLVKRPS